MSHNQNPVPFGVKTLTSGVKFDLKNVMREPMYGYRDQREDILRLAAIEDILVNGSANMSPRHVAETVLRLAREPIDIQSIDRLVSRHASLKSSMQLIDTPPLPTRLVDPEQHVAECCVHHCKFNDFECAIVNGTATADMPCEEGDHL